MSAEPNDNEPKRKKTSQSFAWDKVTPTILQDTEGKRDHAEYVSNHTIFRNKYEAGATDKELAKQAVDAGMRDTCISRLIGFDFGRYIIYMLYLPLHRYFFLGTYLSTTFTHSRWVL